MCVCVYIYVCVCIYIYMCVCVYIYMCVCIYIYIYMALDTKRNSVDSSSMVSVILVGSISLENPD